MKISNITNHFLNKIIQNNENHIRKTQLTKKNALLIKELYKLMNENEKYIPNDFMLNEINIDKNRNFLQEYDFLYNDNIFLSEEIQKKIKSGIKKIKIFSKKIFDIKYNIHFFLFDKSNNIIFLLNEIMRIIFLISRFNLNNKVKEIDVHFILLDLKKELPKKEETLNSYHVNTGLTWACMYPRGKIIIYRKEECLKVFIHELLHALCFDLSNLNINERVIQKITNMFYIKESYFSVTETYCEFWANIINSLLFCYNHTNSENDFMNLFLLVNTFERNFAIFQCVKILDYMGLKYSTIISKSKINKTKSIKKYKEKSNVFAYYILKMIWLYFTDDFLSLFDNLNINLLNSKKDYNYLYELLNKTSVLYKKRIMLKDIKENEKMYAEIKRNKQDEIKLGYTLRMSIIEDAKIN